MFFYEKKSQITNCAPTSYPAINRTETGTKTGTRAEHFFFFLEKKTDKHPINLDLLPKYLVGIIMPSSHYVPTAPTTASEMEDTTSTMLRYYMQCNYRAFMQRFNARVAETSYSHTIGSVPTEKVTPLCHLNFGSSSVFHCLKMLPQEKLKLGSPLTKKEP